MLIEKSQNNFEKKSENAQQLLFQKIMMKNE